MPLSFPINPTINQTYQSGSSSTYQWNGSFWQTLLPPTQVTLFATSASFAPSNIPNWISAGTIQAVGISGSTSAPTMPTTTVTNQVLYKQIGPKTWQVRAVIEYTNSTGATAGSGDYLFTLPAGLQFDTSIPNQSLYTANVNTSATETISKVMRGSISYGTDNSTFSSTFQNGIIPYTTTQYRVTLSTNSTFRCWGSGWFAMNSAPRTMNWEFTFQSL